jgi:3-dehydrotetronate 4-kinase
LIDPRGGKRIFEMAPILGCIADDFTGATDLANMLVRGGLRTVQLLGVPDRGDPVPDVDAVVVALKSRTIPPAEAVSQSLATLRWLQAAGARQIFFKYCSTFDSTDEGNIGPVTDALMDELGADFTVACSAFPETGRTIFKGHLFVGDQLLSDTHMHHHPLTPMTDSNLVAVLGRQTRRDVGLIQHNQIEQGAAAITAAMTALKADGKSIAIVDAVDDAQLTVIGEALADLKLITGGSGIALGLPANYRKAGLVGENPGADQVSPVTGLALVLSGSCSTATLAQVAVFATSRPTLPLDPLEIANDPSTIDRAIDWAKDKLSQGPALIHASAPPDSVKAVQDKLGRNEAGELVERAMAKIATALAEAGVRRLVVAGGETSGAVVSALGVKGLLIGAQIDPGVPGTVTMGDQPMALALKSGNFGAPDFFEKALRIMP